MVQRDHCKSSHCPRVVNFGQIGPWHDFDPDLYASLHTEFEDLKSGTLWHPFSYPCQTQNMTWRGFPLIIGPKSKHCLSLSANHLCCWVCQNCNMDLLKNAGRFSYYVFSLLRLSCLFDRIWFIPNPTLRLPRKRMSCGELIANPTESNPTKS